MKTDERFQFYLEAWLEVVKSETSAYYTRMFPTLQGPTFELQHGPRYIRVVSARGSDRSVHSFIDKSNGDVLKAASWKAPAKHARGNIFTDSTGLDGRANIAYLR